MSKVTHISTALSLTLISVLIQPSFAVPSDQNYSQSEISHSSINDLFCYVQLEDGRIINLQNLCSRQTVNNSTPKSKSSDSSNYNPVSNTYNPNSSILVPTNYNPNNNTPVNSNYNPNSY